MIKTGLYIHIPFCRKKCNYCDFYSLPCATNENISEYIDSMCAQIESESKEYKNRIFDTVFIGGGTPTLVNEADFSHLVKTIKKHLNLTQGAEFTVEANPDTITKEKLLAYKENGVNRLSIGLQSANEKELLLLGRIHTLDKFKKSFSLARECGFDNINIDIMYGLPEQKLEDFIKTLDTVSLLNPEHISAYCLKIEENTPFGKIKDSLSLPSDEEESTMYQALYSYLDKKGYLQYEISNFSKQGYRCQHNMKYWLCMDYVGIGASAHSFVGGKRYYYSSDINEYISSVKNGSLPRKIYDVDYTNNSHSIDQNSKIDEYIMLKLRLSDGIELTEFKNRFNIDFYDYAKEAREFLSTGHAREYCGNYSLTPKGFFVSNYILLKLLKL